MSWRSTWQQELLTILSAYRSYRQRNRSFFLLLFLFFILINTLCFWLAVSTAFPELLDQQLLRMIKIQIPVAILGGLFDSLSFFITVWLVYWASRTSTGSKFIAILCADLTIAAFATAWVLLVVIVSSWIIGPPEAPLEEELEIVAIVEPVAEAISVTPTVPVVEANSTEEITAPGTTAPGSTEPLVIVTPEEEVFATSFYQNLLLDALGNPFENFRYFWFGIVMGFSTLLPTLFHSFIALRSVFLTNSDKRIKLPV